MNPQQAAASPILIFISPLGLPFEWISSRHTLQFALVSLSPLSFFESFNCFSFRAKFRSPPLHPEFYISPFGHATKTTQTPLCPLRPSLQYLHLIPANNISVTFSHPHTNMDKLPLPTVDRPFGIELWPFLDKAYEAVVGQPASEFQFLPGYTPLSTIPEVFTAILSYYVIIFAGKKLMKNRPAMKLSILFMAHNLILTFISGALLALFIEQLFPILWRHGVFYSICSPNCWTQKIVTLYYVFVPLIHFQSF